VAIVLRTEPAFLDAFFGAWLAGAVPVPLYPPVRLGRLDEYLAATTRLLRRCQARLVVSGGAAARLIGQAVAEAGPALGWLDADALLGTPAWRGPPPHAGDAGLIQFSSGSTADPKPVLLTHGALQAQTDALMALVAPTGRDVLVSWLPLYHDMGLVGALLGAMSYPGPLVLIAPEHFLARPALWPRAVARHRGSISVAPSFAWAYCAERVAPRETEGLDLSTWRLALDGAEPISAAAMRAFAARFAGCGFAARAFLPVYGLSEATLAVTAAVPGQGLVEARVDAGRLARDGLVVPGTREVVSVGVPVPGAEVALRDPGGREVGPGRLGRIWVRGPSLLREVLGDPEETARLLQDGWLDTGDLGFEHGGQLYVHGRIKDLVIVHGANHSPEEFEAALAGLPGLRPGCAVALGHAPAGSAGEGLLVLAERGRRAGGEDDATLVERIRAAVLSRTGVAAQQVHLLAPGTLPRTSSGKLRRSEALRRFLAGELAPPRAPGLLGLAARAVRSRLALARTRHPDGP
jgi:acyl-CoA synthetase (AMP-forming)/AMP-acid ligase II